MAGMRMENAMRYLKRGLDATVGKVVDIHIGDESILSLDAVPVQSNFQDFATEEFVNSAMTFDWIVKSDELRLVGVKVEPAKGWEIWYQVDEGRYAVYKAQPGSGTRCYDVEDPLGLLYCIHTKLDRFEQI